MITTNKLSDLHIHKESRILVVMPHPDDETVFVSGLLHRLATHHVATRALTMTAGEKSTLRHGLHPSADLASVRKKELSKAYHHIGITDFAILNFPDGGLEKQKREITELLIKEIKTWKPTHVITLEPDGIYGHPDHIALSLFTKQCIQKPIQLVWATMSPHHMQPKARHMAKKAEINPVKPDIIFKLTASDTFTKLKAFTAHRSQFMSLKTTPRDFIFFLLNQLLTREFYAFGN